MRSSLARYRHKAELHLAVAFRKLGEGHAAEADVYHTCNTLAKQCEAHSEMLGPFVDRYSEGRRRSPTTSIMSSSTRRAREGWASSGTCTTSTSWRTLDSCEGQTATQIELLRTRMKQAAPQALLVAS